METSPAPPVDAGFWRQPAPTGLRAFYTEIIGYEERGAGPVHQVETASLTIPLIFSFGAPFEIGLGRRPERSDAVPSFLAGLSREPVFIRSNGGSRCLQINFTPLGARRFFRMPLSVISERMAPVADIADRDLADFRDRIEDLPTWSARIDFAAAHVAHRLFADAPAETPSERVFRRLVASGGRVPVARLCEEVGWSRKHLAQVFRRDIGLTPKSVARIARFQTVVAGASAALAPDWSGMAHDCGYADQAHLIREFVEFSGEAPSAFSARLAAGLPQAW